MHQLHHSDDSERFKFYIILCATDTCGQLGNTVELFRQALDERDLGHLKNRTFLSKQLINEAEHLSGRLKKLKDDIYDYFKIAKETENGSCLQLITLR